MGPENYFYFEIQEKQIELGFFYRFQMKDMLSNICI